MLTAMKPIPANTTLEQKRQLVVERMKAVEMPTDHVAGWNLLQLNAALGIHPDAPIKVADPEKPKPPRKFRPDFQIVPAGPLRTEAEVRAWDWRNRVLPLVESSTIEERYRVEILPDAWDCEPQKQVYGLCRRAFRGVGAIVALIGERGVGKTMVGGQLIVAEAWQGRIAPYRKLAQIVSRYKPLYGDFGTIEETKLSGMRDTLCHRRLLVIDEIHEPLEQNRLALPILTDILDRRYSAKVDTLLISNQKMQEFKASVNDSILSRITEHGVIKPCEWQSWRERIASK